MIQDLDCYDPDFASSFEREEKTVGGFCAGQLKRSNFCSKEFLYLHCGEYIHWRKRRVKAKRLVAATRVRKEGWDQGGSGRSDTK